MPSRERRFSRENSTQRCSFSLWWSVCTEQLSEPRRPERRSSRRISASSSIRCCTAGSSPGSTARRFPSAILRPSESMTAGGSTVRDFNETAQKSEDIRDERGRGRRLTLTGVSGGLQKKVVVTVYDDTPRMAFFQVRYTNKAGAPTRVSGWTNHAYSIAAQGRRGRARILVVPERFLQKPPGLGASPQGRLQAGQLSRHELDRLRRRNAGLRCLAARRGHRDRSPGARPQARFAADHDAGRVACHHGSSFKSETTLKPGESLDTFPTFVAVHQGDYFQSLKDYSAAMQHRGVKFDPAPESAFGADLVRLGLRENFHSRAGGERAAGRQEARVFVGRSGRRMADQRRRLGSAARQISERRPRHAGAGGQDPRPGIPRAALVGASRHQARRQHRQGASRSNCC